MIRDKALKSRLESVADSTFTSILMRLRFSLCKHFQNPFVKNNILYKIAEQKMWLSRFGIAFFTFLANLLDRAKGPIPCRLYDILMRWSSKCGIFSQCVTNGPFRCLYHSLNQRTAPAEGGNADRWMCGCAHESRGFGWKVSVVELDSKNKISYHTNTTIHWYEFRRISVCGIAKRRAQNCITMAANTYM